MNKIFLISSIFFLLIVGSFFIFTEIFNSENKNFDIEKKCYFGDDSHLYIRANNLMDLLEKYEATPNFKGNYKLEKRCY